MSVKEDVKPFKKHYTNNSEAFNAKRRDRYENDPVYRERVRQQKALQTEKKRQERGAGLVEVPSEYTHTVVSILGEPPLVARNTISGWINKGLLPQPSKFNGVYYFTDSQASAMVDFLTAVVGRKRVFTSGEFDAQIEAVKAAFE